MLELVRGCPGRAVLAVALCVLVVGCTVDEDPSAATPSQPEGPYYPVDKPVDRDNDLTVVDGLDRVAEGQTLVLSGSLRDRAGDPVRGATIEIWQTDTNGIYLHPDDPDVASRDQAFQGYGEAVTDADGAWEFTTVDPGRYEPRPRHIHVKVVVDGTVVLTTQIYFSDDPEVARLDQALVADVALESDGSSSAAHLLVVEL